MQHQQTFSTLSGYYGILVLRYFFCYSRPNSDLIFFFFFWNYNLSVNCLIKWYTWFKINVIKAVKPTLTLMRYISNGDASDFWVTEAKEESPTGRLFQNQVDMLLSNETKNQPRRANSGHRDWISWDSFITDWKTISIFSPIAPVGLQMFLG